MADYKIIKLSQQPPRQWGFTNKAGEEVTLETYKVLVEGEDAPVDVTRKPGNAPKVGDVLTGTLETTDFGKKFKAERKPFAPPAKDQNSIRAQWAIGQAIVLTGKPVSAESIGEQQRDIEVLAVSLYNMVDRVKDGPVSAPALPSEEKSGYEKAKEAAKRIRDQFADGSPIPEGEEQISLNDIPF